MHIAVLCGGSSSEREVSLRSGAAVSTALENPGDTISVLDPAMGPEALEDKLQGVNVAFPALHGVGGEDGTIQSFLENLHIPYVGSDPVSSKLCFDKWQYRKVLREHAITMAPGELVSEEELWGSALIKEPFVLKPHDGGSSVDTLIARDPHNIDRQQVHAIFSRHDTMLLEKLIEGREITVAVLGDKALPVIEIIPPDAEEFDYANKYNGKTQEICPPLHIDTDAQSRAQQLALTIHSLVGCRDMSRTDMIVTPTNDIFVLETNTIPGMTDQSLLPKAASAAGISMHQLVRTLVEAAAARR